MAELKPCPFCGSEFVAYIEEQHSVFGLIGAVHCRKCSARGAFTLLSKGKSETEAIEDWNNRAESEELKFTRQFIHEHGLEFALASAWSRRAEDGNT